MNKLYLYSCPNCNKTIAHEGMCYKCRKNLEEKDFNEVIKEVKEDLKDE